MLAAITAIYSGLRLREIGEYFGIGESGVTQASRRFGIIVEGDKKLRNTMKEICSKLEVCNV